MRKIDDTERFSAFVVALQRVVTDDTLYKLVWTAGKEMDRDLDSMIDCYLHVASKQAKINMNVLLEIGSKFTNEEMDIIQESRQ